MCSDRIFPLFKLMFKLMTLNWLKRFLTFCRSSWGNIIQFFFFFDIQIHLFLVPLLVWQRQTNCILKNIYFFPKFGHSDTRVEASGMQHRFSLKIMSGVADIRLHFLVDCVSCWQKLGNKQDKYQLKNKKKTFWLRRRSAENNERKLIVKQEMSKKRSRRRMSD